NAPTGSPPMTGEFCHDGLSKVLETTYFGSSFMRSANPSSFGAVGQNAAKISYVTRPSRIAPAWKTSSTLKRCWFSLACRKAQAFLSSGCGSWPGASITPSSVTNSDAISRRTDPPRHAPRVPVREHPLGESVGSLVVGSFRNPVTRADERVGGERPQVK